MTDFVNVDEKGLIKKQIIKDGVGDTPEKYREVYIYYVLRKEDGNLITGNESQPYKVVMGRGDTFSFIETLLSTMKLGERIIAKIDKEYVKSDSKLRRILTVADAKPANNTADSNTGNAEQKNGSNDDTLLTGLEVEIEIVRLMNYRNNLWELESDDRERIVQQIKNEGNEFIKNKDYQNSIYKYESGINTMQNDSSVVFDETKQSLLNNLSLAYLKNNTLPQCIEVATQALENQPENVKLLYRRAQAYSASSEYEKAKIDLQTALNIDPNNAELQKELNLIINKEKIQLQKEKKVYANMFK